MIANSTTCMPTNPRVLKAYINHFLPREVVGPVSIAVSLAGAIDGISNRYIPDEYETLGWALVFTFSIILVAYRETIPFDGVDPDPVLSTGWTQR